MGDFDSDEPEPRRTIQDEYLYTIKRLDKQIDTQKSDADALRRIRDNLTNCVGKNFFKDCDSLLNKSVEKYHKCHTTNQENWNRCYNIHIFYNAKYKDIVKKINSNAKVYTSQYESI